MPAFGKDGIVNLNQTSGKKLYKLVKSDGTVVDSSYDRSVLETKKVSLSQGVNNSYSIIESEVKCL